MSPPVRVTSRLIRPRRDAKPQPKVSAPIDSASVPPPETELAASLSLKIVYLSPAELKPYARQLRRHPRQQLEFLSGNIKNFGLVAPLLIDQDRTVIAGHALLEAAKLIGIDRVPTISITHLTSVQVQALRVSLNKIQSMSDWNEEMLKLELTSLASIDFDLLTFTGFNSAELDTYFGTPQDSDDALPDGESAPVSRAGDVWRFEGGHRFGCLDALDPKSFDLLLDGKLAGLVICDPPYNVKIRGNVTRQAAAREFAMASGEMSIAEFTAFLESTFQNLHEHARDGSLSLQFIDWRHLDEMSSAGRAVYQSLINVAVWVKPNGGMGSLWRSQHELCFAWKKGTVQHVNNVELGKNGRNRSNVWDSSKAGTGVLRHDPESRGHVTPKNVAMIQDAILDVSRRGDIVLDAFAGSATTLVAAHRAKRQGYGLDIDPSYVDLGVRRLQRVTRSPARLLGTGQTFDEVAAERGVPTPKRTRNA